MKWWQQLIVTVATSLLGYVQKKIKDKEKKKEELKQLEDGKLNQEKFENDYVEALKNEINNNDRLLLLPRLKNDENECINKIKKIKKLGLINAFFLVDDKPESFIKSVKKDVLKQLPISDGQKYKIAIESIVFNKIGKLDNSKFKFLVSIYVIINYQLLDEKVNEERTG